MELHKKDDYTFEFLESLIINEIEESINLDYKSGEALSKVDNKKKELSKDVSAFANSNGGIIIYGISEENHKPKEFSFVNGNEFSKEWLEQVINSTIHRSIPDLKIFPIRKNGDLTKTIYVVQIPASSDAPHMAKDNKYYKRYNFESTSMDEYEIRSLYFRKSDSRLLISSYFAYIEKETDDDVTFLFEVDITNVGNNFANEYKVNVYFENHNTKSLYVFTNGFNNKNIDFTRQYNRMKISSEPRKSIYPEEGLNVLRFNFRVDREELKNFCEKTNVKIILFYPFGEDIANYSLQEFYKDPE